MVSDSWRRRPLIKKTYPTLLGCTKMVGMHSIVHREQESFGAGTYVHKAPSGSLLPEGFCGSRVELDMVSEASLEPREVW